MTQIKTQAGTMAPRNDRNAKATRAPNGNRKGKPDHKGKQGHKGQAKKAAAPKVPAFYVTEAIIDRATRSFGGQDVVVVAVKRTQVEKTTHRPIALHYVLRANGETSQMIEHHKDAVAAVKEGDLDALFGKTPVAVESAADEVQATDEAKAA